MQVVLLSFDISQHALSALKQTTTALDVREYEIDPLLAKRDAVLPVKPETPKVLPHVHQLWGPLMAAMQVQSLLLPIPGPSQQLRSGERRNAHSVAKPYSVDHLCWVLLEVSAQDHRE